jgi:hypothetical protein
LVSRKLAVEGEPGINGDVLTVAPSSRKFTVPVGCGAPAPPEAAGGVMVTLRRSLPPSTGVRVAGVRTTDGVASDAVTIYGRVVVAV